MKWFLLLAMLLMLCLIGPISIEIGFVDLSFQTLIIMMIGLIFTPAVSLVALTIYLILGSIGLPVFSGYSSGYEHLTGGSAGFLLFFPVFAFIFSYLVAKNQKKAAFIGIHAASSQLLLLLVGFGYLYLKGFMLMDDIIKNIIQLLPGLIIKAGIVFGLYLLIRRLLLFTK